MTAALTAASAKTVSSSRTQADHVVADTPTLEPRTARIAALIDPAFFAEVGWDPVTRLLSPAAGHPLLGRPVFRAAGCAATATRADRVCVSCRVRLATAGLDAEQLDQLVPRPRPSRGPWPRVVDGCRRTWESARTGLCRTHQDLARSLNVDADQFLMLPQAQPLEALPLCEVSACERQRRRPDGRYCDAHQQPVLQARGRDSEQVRRGPVACDRTVGSPWRASQSPWSTDAGRRRGAVRATATLPA